MKYEVVIPDDKYCKGCPFWIVLNDGYEEDWCNLLKVHLREYNAVKDINCPVRVNERQRDSQRVS